MAEHSENLAGEDYMQVPSYEFRLRNKFYLTERGLVLLINNNEFANLPSRVGSDVDEYNVRALFEGFGYEVLPTLQDLTADVCVYHADDFRRWSYRFSKYWWPQRNLPAMNGTSIATTALLLCLHTEITTYSWVSTEIRSR